MEGLREASASKRKEEWEEGEEWEEWEEGEEGEEAAAIAKAWCSNKGRHKLHLLSS